MKTLSVNVLDIEIGKRLRPLSTDAVKQLAESMKDIGLRHPISIRIVEEMMVDGQMVSGVPVLVAGLHRLEAAKHLGWSQIECAEVTDDDITAELWEIAENLHRCDLSKEQRDDHIRRYVELMKLWTARIVSQPMAPKPAHRPQGIISKVAEKVGLSVDTVRRAVNRVDRKAVVDGVDVVRMQANKIISAWNLACPEARELAMGEIDDPVFDKTPSA